MTLSVKGQSVILAVQAWPREFEAAGHIVISVSKQRGMGQEVLSLPSPGEDALCIKVGLPISLNPTCRLPHRQAQTWVSWGILVLGVWARASLTPSPHL